MTRLGREIVRGYMRHVRGERFSPLWALLTPASWLNRIVVALCYSDGRASCRERV